jgi:hypothetical protein
VALRFGAIVLGVLEELRFTAPTRPNGSNRKPPPRRRVLLTGLIVYGNGAFTCDCSFRNLSSAGARIALKQLVQLPEHFYVINVRDGVAYFSRLIWNEGLEIGIKIESVVPLNSRDDYLTGRLKKLWLAKAPG